MAGWTNPDGPNHIHGFGDGTGGEPNKQRLDWRQLRHRRSWEVNEWKGDVEG